jgi:hypothetical protein
MQRAELLACSSRAALLVWLELATCWVPQAISCPPFLRGFRSPPSERDCRHRLTSSVLRARAIARPVRHGERARLPGIFLITVSRSALRRAGRDCEAAASRNIPATPRTSAGSLMCRILRIVT